MILAIFSWPLGSRVWRVKKWPENRGRKRAVYSLPGDPGHSASSQAYQQGTFNRNAIEIGLRSSARWHPKQIQGPTSWSYTDFSRVVRKSTPLWCSYIYMFYNLALIQSFKYIVNVKQILVVIFLLWFNEHSEKHKSVWSYNAVTHRSMFSSNRCLN